jgi:uncharacterized repeat protein (TIGR01451 family)
MGPGPRGTASSARSAAIAFVLVILSALLAGQAQASHSNFAIGDVFVGVANGDVQWYHPDGTINQTLDNGVGGYTTGMAFDSAGHLYVTNFNAGADAGTPADPSPPEGGGGSVSEFDTDGTNLGLFGGGYTTPEDILFDQSGNAFVGNVGGGILEFDGSGNLLDSFANGRTDFIDLAADQCTMYFSDESGAIHRYDVCTDSALSDFTGAGGQYEFRLLPGGGLIAADSGVINRFDGSGNVIQTYDAPGEDCWFGLNLDPDGTSLWSADFCTADVVKVDISSGNVLLSFNTGTGPNTVFGLGVFGEITQGGGTGANLTLQKSDSPDPVLVGNLLTYTIDLTNLGPEDAANAEVTDDLSPRVDFDSASSSQGTCSEAGGIVTCDLGDLLSGDTATVTITVIPNQEGSVTNTAVGSSEIQDPNLANNSDAATTTVNAAPGGGVGTGGGGTAGPGSTSSGLIALLAALVAGAILGVRRILRT